jgi:hypothetical protein
MFNFNTHRPVINPKEYSALKIIGNALLSRSYNPFGIANVFEEVMDNQMPTYSNIKMVVGNFDLVYAIHSAAATVCDAIEALRQEQEARVPPPRVIVFSSLPYDPVFFRNSESAPKDLWRTPRSLVALPHVAAYPSVDKTLKMSSPLSILSCLLQLFWMWLDTHFAEKAWKIAGKRNDSRRAKRNLPPVHCGNKYYWQNYPVLSMGGITPFNTRGEYIADNVTVVGSLKSNAPVNITRLDDWMCRSSAGKKVIYACFGTGTKLSEEEITNLARMVLALEGTQYRVLLALRKEEHDRYQHTFDKVIGSKPTFQADGVVEYGRGVFRIDADVPQESLLQSGRVVLFVSHMGFGGYTEAINGGVRMVSYPSGCDQWYNAQRAVEAGVAVQANPKMKGLDSTVIDMLDNDTFKTRSMQLASEANLFASDEIILEHADEVAGSVDTYDSETASTCSSDNPFDW